MACRGKGTGPSLQGGSLLAPAKHAVISALQCAVASPPGPQQMSCERQQSSVGEPAAMYEGPQWSESEFVSLSHAPLHQCGPQNHPQTSKDTAGATRRAT
jgi:hypothetical protein